MESTKPKELRDNPREKAGLISKLFFCYTLPIFFKGWSKNLEPSDLYRALEEDKSSCLANELYKAWEEEVQQKTKQGKVPKLFRAAFKVFRGNIVRLGIFVFCLDFFLKITQPIFIGLLVSYYSAPEGSIKQAYLYAGAVVLCSALNVAFSHTFMLGQIHCGMKLRIAMIGMIYRKSLRLSNTALADTTVGKVVNLITNDVGKMDFAMIGLHQLWLGPIETIVIVILIYRQIGVSALAGVIFLLLFIPIQGVLGKKVAVFRSRTAKRTDERVRLMNEIIQAIQLIKMYAWEKSFGDLVFAARSLEIQSIRISSYIKGIMLSFMIFVTRFSIFISLIVYALLGQHVSAEKAFVVTAYYGILRQTMTVMFPRGIAQLAETLVSFKRIESFMLRPETQVKHPVDDHVTLNGDPHTYISVTDTDSEEDRVVDLKVYAKHHRKRLESLDQGVDKGSLKVTNVKAKWDPKATEYTLDGISFEASAGQLIAIIGPVGSGKSSVIQAILGEMEIESGTIEANGVMSYAPQVPWVFSGTVRQNILFGYPMEKRRYRLAVKQCALERDFQQFQHGDRTIVGDRGQSLSGGQKARISLARAIYRKGSMYLLDDPLSAVDSHVARHLFEQCMRKYLRRHIVILVTNELQFLQDADKIIVMNEGRIDKMGTFTELKNSGLDFAHFLADKEEKEEKEADLVDLVATAALLREVYSRQGSIVSITSMEEPEPAPDTRLLTQEVQQYGSIAFNTYKRYFQAGGGVFAFVVMMLFCVMAQLLASGSDYFLAYWVDQETTLELYKNATKAFNISEANGINNDTLFELNDMVERDSADIGIFTALIIGLIVVTISRSVLIFNFAMRASEILHNTMYRGISHAAMYFFNTNPAGRILNRFSKDMGQVDEVLPSILIDMLQVFFTLIGILIVISVVNSWFLIPAATMILIFYLLRDFYLKTSRNVTRMEGVARSPVYSHLAASLHGLSTIRAFDAQIVLVHEFDALQDAHSSVFYTMISSARAFGFWLDVVCVLYITMVTMSFFVFDNDKPGNIGLALTQAIGMTGMVQWGMRQSAEMENIMTAVERVTEYEKIENEEKSLVALQKPPKGWPHKGHIKFSNLSLKYSPDPGADLVLKNLDFEIYPSEKIGIVGRTGAGKSSLINAIFRLSFTEGDIFIDDRNISEFHLSDLRSKISIIPQVPVLFSGALRFNLDPFDERTDTELWQVLEEVKLKEVVADLPEGLQTKVTESGTNLSVGQRQLICLARTILRKNKIVIMDEATSNVDPQTDALIFSTIQEKFKECTVITIAHRLNSVMRSDRVIVMDGGRIIETGIPYILLTESESKIFRHMARETGKATFNNLVKIAKESFEAKKNI